MLSISFNLILENLFVSTELPLYRLRGVSVGFNLILENLFVSTTAERTRSAQR